MKGLMLGAVVLLACASLPVAIAHQESYTPARPGNAVHVTANARHSLDSLFRWSVEHHVETGACIAKADYHIRDSSGVLSFWVSGIMPGNIKVREATLMIWAGSLCGDTLPSVHVHWMDPGIECPTCVRWAPSPIDVQTAISRPMIPFHLLVSDTGYYLPYLVQP